MRSLAFFFSAVVLLCTCAPRPGDFTPGTCRLSEGCIRGPCTQFDERPRPAPPGDPIGFTDFRSWPGRNCGPAEGEDLNQPALFVCRNGSGFDPYERIYDTEGRVVRIDFYDDNTLTTVRNFIEFDYDLTGRVFAATSFEAGDPPRVTSIDYFSYLDDQLVLVRGDPGTGETILEKVLTHHDNGTLASVRTRILELPDEQPRNGGETKRWDELGRAVEVEDLTRSEEAILETFFYDDDTPLVRRAERWVGENLDRFTTWEYDSDGNVVSYTVDVENYEQPINDSGPTTYVVSDNCCQFCL